MRSLLLRSALTRPMFFAAVLSGSAAAFAASAPSYTGNGEPLHPTAVTTPQNGEMVPIVGVNDQTAQMLVDDKATDVPKDATFSFVRVASFAPGVINIESHEIRQVVKETRTADGVIIQELSDKEPHDEYHATLVSPQTYADAFLVLVVFDRNFLTGAADAPSTAVFFKNIGTLEANQPHEVAISLGKFSPAAREKMQYFPLIFTGGREVRTQLAELSAAYFRRQEMTRHAALVAGYMEKNAEADRPLQPYLRVSPIIPAGTGDTQTSVKARLSVDTDGTVKQVTFQSEVPEAIRAELERALSGWLFLPKLVKGKPVTTAVVLPLNLKL